MEELNLNQSIAKIKVELQKSKLKMSGKNKFVGFNYFELSDFLPRLNELLLEYGVNDNFTITTDSTFGTDYAVLTLIKKEEKQEYKMPFKLFDTPLNTGVNKVTGEAEKVKCMQDIQYLGALNTYYKRYLYMNAFGITDGDVIDGIDNTSIASKKSVSLATEKQIANLKKLYSEEELVKALGIVKKTKIEDLTVQEASSLIAKRIKKDEAKTNE